MIKLYEESNIQAIADAIRAKNGSTDTYTTSEMAAAIAAIESLNYDKMIAKTITEVSSNLTMVGDYAFYNCASLASADFPKAVEIGDNAFYGTTALKNANFPLVLDIERYAFRGSGIVNANFPNAIYVGSTAFGYNSALKTANLPKITETSGSMFSNCTALETVDLAKVTKLGNYTFENCYSLKAVVLRKDDYATLGSNVFTNCYHLSGTVNSTYNPSGSKDGYIYVPRSKSTAYGGMSGWQNYGFQFRALEDYTVDGTITGALDESKI